MAHVKTAGESPEPGPISRPIRWAAAGAARGVRRVAWGVACLAVCLVPVGTAHAQWWDSNWLERRKLTINNSDQTEDLDDFPLLVKLDGTRIDYTKTLNLGEDIRFIDDDDLTELKYEIEKWDESGTSYVWVKVPQIDGSSSTDHIWIYYDYFAASDNQDPPNVWTNGYAGVWHLKEDPTPSAGSWYGPSWNYRKKITIDNTKVTATLTNFPVLISITDTDIQAAARSDGFDILFTNSDSVTKLDHEIEKWDIATGELVAWVKIPSLPDSADKDIYVYYGNSGAADQQNVTGVWDANFKAVLHLNETVDDEQTTGVHLDSTSNNNDGGQNNNDDAPGPIGTGQDFDGTDDRVILPDAASLDATGPGLTVSAWIQPDFLNTSVDRVIADKWLSNTGWRLWFKDNRNDFRFEARIANSNKNATTSGATWTAGTKHYVVGVYDGGRIRIYLDGVQDASTVATGNLVASTEDLTIGIDAGSTNDPFLGDIDEVRISDTRRSADWILTEYNNQSNPGGFHTVDVEEQKPVGGLMSDSTANNNHGASAGSMDFLDQVAGQIGGSVNLDGIDDYISTANSINDPQNITVEAWFKTGTPSGYKMVGFENAQTGTAATKYDRHLYIGIDGRVYFGSWDTDADVAVSINPLDDDQWHYAVGTQDDIGNTITLYIDGALQDSAVNDKAFSYTGWWRIGSHQLSGFWPNWAGGSGYLPGTIDEVRISNVVRSGDWTTAQYKSITDTFIVWKPKIIRWTEVDPFGP
ncbi:MAG: DUF2341 domain-containing protein [Planctomycetes bacterium]|nr:DUF2341 domain-containing protein [Planctomycetota bacterium]